MNKEKCLGCAHTKNENIFIFENQHWMVFLSEDQYYLGRCIVSLKRHCESLSKLKEDEWIDFLGLVKKFELALKKAFGATLFNWGCLMNNAYKSEKPCPHVHWHVRPRYGKTVKFVGLEFKDREFSHHYARKTGRKISKDIQKKIINKIRESLV